MSVTEEAGTREAGSDDAGDRAELSLSDGVTVGLLAVVAGTVGVMAVIAEIIVPPLVFLIVFVGLGVWAARSGSTRLRWTIAGLLTLFLALNAIFAVSDLAHPESPAPFIATVVVVGAGLITIVLAVLAARGKPRVGRRVWTAALGGLALVAVGSVVAAAAVQDDAAQPGDTTIVAADTEFPDEVVLDTSSDALLIQNSDRFRHTFVIDDQVSPVEIPADSDVRIELGDQAAGSYRYYCDVPGHESMEGTLVIR